MKNKVVLMKRPKGINAAFIGEEQQVISIIRAGDIPLVYGSPEAILSASWRSMLVSKIWTERIIAVEAHLPEFTCQFTLIIITSFYFHNVTAYELFIVHEIEHDLESSLILAWRPRPIPHAKSPFCVRDRAWSPGYLDTRPFPLNRHFACMIGCGLCIFLCYLREYT